MIVGVKNDQPGLGQFDPTTNTYSGFDIEIARMIAANLGFDPKTEIDYVVVQSAAREDAISRGDVDYYVGTYTINDKRKERVGFAGPYFVAGQDLLVKKDNTDITGPQTLQGKTVCSVTGSTPIQRVREQNLTQNIVEFQTYCQCVDQLLQGQVDAVTTDDAILKGYAAQQPDELKVVGKTFSEEPYGIGVPQRRHRAARRRSTTSCRRRYDDGTWQEIYDATLGQVRLAGRAAADRPVLTTRRRGGVDRGPTPPTASSGEDADVDVLLDNLPLFYEGFLGTIALFLISAVGSLVLGGVLAAMRVSPVPVAARRSATVYVNVVRNTPLTLVLFFFAFAWNRDRDHLVLVLRAARASALIVYTSAFVCEVLRSGINTVPVGQAEASRALGLTFGQTLTAVVLPQALRAVVPPLISVVIALLKNTTIAAGFSVVEAGRIIPSLSERGYSSLIGVLWVAVGFVILVIPLTLLQHRLEKRWRVAR